MKLLLPLVAITLLSACAGNAQVNYYQVSMPLAAATAVSETQGTLPLQLQPVKVANYLNGAGLVMQRSEVELVVASRNLWADALDQQLYRLLAEQIRARLPGIPVATATDPAAIRLHLTIDRFHAQANGNAVISGFYSLDAPKGRITQSFSYQRPLDADGYPALVRALSHSWQQLVSDLIVHIEQQYL
ncbi:hypothetical protein WG68_01275 [Arsukibacterium ikkense]|uniref:ABC-type transport auxiliary lipoprotein component domain-containing protein n=1 Tax=Arsukibacterium ikkense TaxID=336831 RepID=A0A0M2V9M1_9GAMM|nr:ABC-type transport auxiliary lipoprotein family protein [Arsukibacterium ikkense]KKO47301.1 hypothetical protein WG68_01275 [Arsukibacterium ikkense]